LTRHDVVTGGTTPPSDKSWAGPWKAAREGRCTERNSASDSAPYQIVFSAHSIASSSSRSWSASHSTYRERTANLCSRRCADCAL